jgi:hypothetical protein
MEKDNKGCEHMDKYLKPMKDPHIRIGNSYQARIPHNEHNIPHNNVDTQYNISHTITISEEVEQMKPNKKRRIDS